MCKLWVKFKERNPVLVPTEGCDYVAEFLEACKKKLSPLFDSIAIDQLVLSSFDRTFRNYDAIPDQNTGSTAYLISILDQPDDVDEEHVKVRAPYFIPQLILFLC
jgi:hypothetical protein